MQVIAGEYRGRRLESPSDSHTHPMGSREKNALFNMLETYLHEAIVLDAFAGSGALGIEAISRGAKKCIFVEKSPKNASLIKKNISSLGENVVKNTTIFTKKVEDFSTKEQFDIIIADPPYGDFEQINIEYLGEFLSDNGIFALSHPKDSEAKLPKNFYLLKSHSYAAARISIFQKH